MALNQKQENFCLRYVEHGEGKRAATEAGYLGNNTAVTAANLLKKPEVQARLRELRRANEERTQCTVEDLINELALIGFSDLKHFIDVQEGGGIVFRGWDHIPKPLTRCIRKIKSKRTIRQTDGDSGDILVDDNLELELWDKNKALEMLGKNRGMFTDTGHGGAQPLLIESTDGKFRVTLGAAENKDPS